MVVPYLCIKTNQMLASKIFAIQSEEDFEQVCLQVFQYQYKNCIPYRKFCNLLNTDPKQVKQHKDIPFLPIEFFKSHKIFDKQKNKVESIFTSSGTTGMERSQHYVANNKVYEESFLKAFQQFYGKVTDYTILALLPSYLEREGSSLIYMVDKLIKDSNNPSSGFYLHNTEDLLKKLLEQEQKGKKTILIGVSYALLDLIEEFDLPALQHTIIMETGGMKGKRKELIKQELHKILAKGFGVSDIHSEYGMTELLSQAYSKQKGFFYTPPWMRVLTRDTEDPLSYVEFVTGGINVIDLANLHSCSFIATQDLGKLHPDGSFEIIGRFDNSDIRGCNLLLL